MAGSGGVPGGASGGGLREGSPISVWQSKSTVADGWDTVDGAMQPWPTQGVRDHPARRRGAMGTAEGERGDHRDDRENREDRKATRGYPPDSKTVHWLPFRKAVRPAAASVDGVIVSQMAGASNPRNVGGGLHEGHLP